MEKALMLIAALFLASCQSTPSECDVFRPYHWESDAEILATPPGPRRHIVTENRKGQELCGWNP